MQPPTQSLVDQLSFERHRLERGLLARNTQLGYAFDWAHFTTWCDSLGHTPLPATTETVSLYLTAMLAAGKKVSTATRHGSAINHQHAAAGFPRPITREIRSLLHGAQRIRGEQPRQMHPLELGHLRAISRVLTREGSKRAIRNRAILLVGFASALRRASLCALQLEDVEFAGKGLVLHIRREKQDQEGRGRLIGLPRGQFAMTCPVRCLQAWLKLRGNAPGPLFTRVEPGLEDRALCPPAIERMVKACMVRIGVSPAGYAGHSLRSGFITEAGENGIGELLIAAQTGHRDMNTLRRYFRRMDVWKSNAAGMIGL